jgi:hypothetical protein
MIVKIDVNDGWIFIDDVYNVEIRRHCKEVQEDNQAYFVTQVGAKFGADMIVRANYVGPDGAVPEFKVVSCFRGDNIPMTYAFNTYGYLMNDEGKTIESI